MTYIIRFHDETGIEDVEYCCSEICMNRRLFKLGIRKSKKHPGEGGSDIKHGDLSVDFGVNPDLHNSTDYAVNCVQCGEPMWEGLNPQPISLEAELRDAWEGEGNSKKITFLKWVRAMAANDAGTLQKAAQSFLAQRKK